MAQANLDHFTSTEYKSVTAMTSTATITAAAIKRGFIAANPSTTAATYTSPTAALLAAEYPNLAVNDLIKCALHNIGTSTGIITIAGGTGVTLKGSGIGITVPAVAAAELWFICTDATNASETFDLYVI